jgi:hypothetical protein
MVEIISDIFYVDDINLIGNRNVDKIRICSAKLRTAKYEGLLREA